MGNVLNEAFIALPSLPGDWPNEILLLDAKWLAFHHEIKTPITIAKTKFTIDIKGNKRPLFCPSLRKINVTGCL